MMMALGSRGGADAQRALDSGHQRDMCIAASAHCFELVLGVFAPLMSGSWVSESSLVTSGDAVLISPVEETTTALGSA